MPAPHRRGRRKVAPTPTGRLVSDAVDRAGSSARLVADLAERGLGRPQQVGVYSVRSIRSWWGGVRIPSAEVVWALAELYGLSLDAYLSPPLREQLAANRRRRRELRAGDRRRRRRRRAW